MNNENGRSSDLDLAMRIANECDPLSVSRFGAQDLKVSEKPDMTLVTDADRAVEDLIRRRLNEARPDDSVLGEEGGVTGSGSRQWIIDPIDGTHNFVRGVPVWATLIALAENGQVTTGVVSAPALGRRWWATKGHGAYAQVAGLEPKQIHVSNVERLDSASMSYSSLGGWRGLNRERQFQQLISGCWRTRAYGDFWSYMLVAEGAVDIATEPELALYDIAALVPIVEEAGGCFTSLEGEDGPWGPNAVATNGLLHSQALGLLNAS